MSGNTRIFVGVILLLLGITGTVACEKKPPRTPSKQTDNHGDHDDHDHSTGSASKTSHQGDHKHEHEGHDHGEHVLRLDPEMAKQSGISLATAGSGLLSETLKLPGEISLNEDSVAHIVPRVTGIVHEVRKTLGASVSTGDVLAILESRELAEAKAADLAAEARLAIAKSTLARQEELQGVIAGRELLEARRQVEEALIEHRTTEAKLHALGLSHDEVSALAKQDEALFSHYEILAPFVGTIIEKHITKGEYVAAEQDIYVLADLSVLWANITVYARDISKVKMGAEVVIRSEGVEEKAQGKVMYVSPVLDESTRTGLVRATIENTSRNWRPGMFVEASITVNKDQAKVVVPKSAVQTIQGERVVFVAADGGFVDRPVVLGRSDGEHIEVLEGLDVGEQYVAKGSFLLKAEMGKGEAKHEH